MIKNDQIKNLIYTNLDTLFQKIEVIEGKENNLKSKSNKEKTGKKEEEK